MRESRTHLAAARRLARLGGAVALIAVAGCASEPAPPAELSGVLRATTDLNPSVSRRPSPLVVRVYELKTAAAFGNADFVALYQRDQAELGPEMIGRDEYLLNPGDSKTFAKVCGPDTRFIGVIGAHRELDRARWRSVVAVQAHRKQRILISAEALAITAAATLEFPLYRHDDLGASFAPVVETLRRLLSAVHARNALQIELAERSHGVRIGMFADPTLPRTASFVLAVNAQMPSETLRQSFPSQSKLGPIDRCATWST